MGVRRRRVMLRPMGTQHRRSSAQAEGAQLRAEPPRWSGRASITTAWRSANSSSGQPERWAPPRREHQGASTNARVVPCNPMRLTSISVCAPWFARGVVARVGVDARRGKARGRPRSVTDDVAELDALRDSGASPRTGRRSLRAVRCRAQPCSRSSTMSISHDGVAPCARFTGRAQRGGVRPRQCGSSSNPSLQMRLAKPAALTS